MLITTTETVPGHAIERVLGLVETSSWFSFGAARRRLAAAAQAAGANAVVGAAYAGGSPGGFSGTVLYGTAVVIRPEIDRG
jgi:uncharacterized protein YbjQ (UPF0145 family)